MSVRVEEIAFSDVRIAALGELAGYNAYEALGRMAHLWRHCTRHGAYVISETIVRVCLGPKGVDALVGAELGERTADGGVRVKGTEGRIEWLGRFEEGVVAGGKARASTAARGPDGRMLPRQNGESIQRNPAESPAGLQLDQQAGPAAPAPSSPPSPSLIQEEEGRSEKVRALTVVKPSGISIPIAGDKNGDKEHPVSLDDVEEWRKAFPGIDVEQELRSMRAWCLASPERRKTDRGVMRFIVGWLKRAQDTPKQGPRGAPSAVVTRKGRELQASMQAGPEMFEEFSRAKV